MYLKASVITGANMLDDFERSVLFGFLVFVVLSFIKYGVSNIPISSVGTLLGL